MSMDDVVIPVEEIVATLQECKDILFRDGWCKGRSHTPDGEAFTHCALGAVESAATGYWTRNYVPDPNKSRWSTYETHVKICRMQELLHQAAYRRSHGVYGDIAGFNDDEKTKFDDVIAVFDDAIILAKEKADG